MSFELSLLKCRLGNIFIVLITLHFFHFLCYVSILVKMKHEYKTRGKRQESLYQEDIILQLQENNMNNINLNINALRVEIIINLEDIIMKRLQDENQKLQVKSSKLW